MNRRRFLSSLFAAAGVAVVEPKISYFLAPAGGWIPPGINGFYTIGQYADRWPTPPRVIEVAGIFVHYDTRGHIAGLYPDNNMYTQYGMPQVQENIRMLRSGKSVAVMDGYIRFVPSSEIASMNSFQLRGDEQWHRPISSLETRDLLRR